MVSPSSVPTASSAREGYHPPDYLKSLISYDQLTEFISIVSSNNFVNT